MPSTLSRPILILAGESSGDALGADLVTALKAARPTVPIFGMGGKRMASAGANLLLDCEQIAVVGFTEIVKKAPPIWRAYRKVKHVIKTQRPGLVILIDYPGFNLRMAKYAKTQGIPTLYYVSPQVWAWRQHRIHFMKRYVDHMAVLFPFETKIYKQADIPVTYVGHPMAHRPPPSPWTPPAALQTAVTDPTVLCIGLFPGSREQEIRAMMPRFVAAMHQIKRTYPTAQFILPIANPVAEKALAPWQAEPIHYVHDSTADLLPHLNLAIATSGTVTLEIALGTVPLIITYRLSPVTFQLAKYVVQVTEIGLCNLIAEERIAPELIQHEATPERITEEALHWLNTPERITTYQAQCADLRKKLHTQQSPSASVAEIAWSLYIEE